MSQNQKSGAAAVEYGLKTAKKIAESLGARKIGNLRSNEYDLAGKRIVITIVRATMNSVGVPYHMLVRIDAIIGSFETETGTYDLYEMTPKVYKENMRATYSKGSSSGRVGMVRKSAFINNCREWGRLLFVNEMVKGLSYFESIRDPQLRIQGVGA